MSNQYDLHSIASSSLLLSQEIQKMSYVSFLPLCFRQLFYFVIADSVSRLSEAAFFLHYPLFSKHPFK